ncbi:DUF2147 domain-containing protein [Luteibacter pinisoli]|jgi:uncharacterized protein (DUF2147 family)|uniref:DUF2147 domain-containing protein n=1 Tax=Luteibacter pinisoli TaxID=2589080 RepID=A0A4Y5Z3I7_9GAMM|nr:DUF2147 domain-containing protein [Luteibacter pinisoli]QDE39085.1 DUF2147 domain-containing protein [Luteibacter pinisoli]
MKHLIRTAAALAFATAALPALAATDTPVGKWKTIDDKTHEVKSIVEITDHNGLLEGKVLEVLKSDEGPHPLCKECDGDRKNKPIEGMTIMWGLKKDGDQWSGGQILDPAKGKIYKVTLKLEDGGKKLDVHGYIGFSLIGRSQEWVRAE